jgi:hypothetical protein
MVVMRKEDVTDNELVRARRVGYCRGEGLFPQSGSTRSRRIRTKISNGQTDTQRGGMKKHGKETKREEWSGSRAGVKRMVFCGLTEGLVIRNMRRGGMLIMEESDQGEHRWWSRRDVWGRESREADDDV